MMQCILLILLSLFAISPCFAASIGIAASGSLGTADETRYRGGAGPDKDDVLNKHKYDQTRESIGFVVDTLSNKESIYSTRLGFFYTLMQAKDGPNNYKLRGITSVTDFCFGVVRKQDFRFWIGPELIIEHLSGPRTRDGGSDYGYHTNFGIGGAVGININTRLGVVFAKGSYDISGALMANDWTWVEKYGGLTLGIMFPFD